MCGMKKDGIEVDTPPYKGVELRIQVYVCSSNVFRIF